MKIKFEGDEDGGKKGKRVKGRDKKECEQN